MRHLLPAALFAALCVVDLRAQLPLPERPTIWRDVTSIVDGVYPSNPHFIRPHIPAIRTTRDGRIGLIVEGGNLLDGTPRFILMTPEKMNARFFDSAAGAFTVSSQNAAWLTGYANPQASQGAYVKNPVWSVAHSCLWDDEGPRVDSNNDEYYDLKIFVTVNFPQWNDPQGPQAGSQFFVTPVRVTVHNPKTANAAIVSVQKMGDPVGGPRFSYSQGAFEPVIVGDGRLLIVRVYSASPIYNGHKADIVYSYYPPTPGDSTADPTKWTTLWPISHAYFDTVVHNTYPFAFHQFRDAEGNFIGDGVDIGGSYPWMDREAKNLFIEGIHDLLHYHQGGQWYGRYVQELVPNDYWGAYLDANGQLADLQEDGGLHQGITMMGLWTQGKMVQIDNLNNDMDYAVGTGDGVPHPSHPGENLGPQQRLVTLFHDPSATTGSDKLLLGYGRATQRMPTGENDNGNIIDSLENKLNYRAFLRPQSFHDVVWHLNNSRQSDELVFDDFLDPDALVIANMTGLLTLQQGFEVNALDHHTGWDTGSHTFTPSNIRLQNAATANATTTSSPWNVPASGVVTGPGRVEPAATGGIHGKGFWMDGTIGIDFDVPAQPSPTQVGSHDWYVGLFVDCRFDNDGIERRLLTFPDNTSIRLYGRRQLVYADANQNVLGRITLPAPDSTNYPGTLDDLLPKRGWAHLAFQIRRSGAEVDFLLDGLPFSHWQHPSAKLFQMTTGHLVVGNKPGTAQPGFGGWIDDLRVLAHTVDPETACNHAGGTLVGAVTGALLTKFASRFPSWTHDKLSAELRNRGETPQPPYACYFDHLHDNGTDVSTLPPTTVLLREAMHFPEGPLFWDRPRPGTTQNSFCASCHNGNGMGGLSTNALTYDALHNAIDDLRRQPAQPPRRLCGYIPAGLVEGAAGNLPATPVLAPPPGHLIDEWMMPAYTAPNAIVQSITVLDTSGKELMDLGATASIDPARLGTNNSFQFRANLDHAQGAVTFVLDGGAPITIGSSPYQIAATLTPGLNHTLSATPGGSGATFTSTFTLEGNSIRIVAGYGSDFQPNGPKAGWHYCWNPTAALTAPRYFVPLNWHPRSAQYTAFGLNYPEAGECASGALSASGGYPGMGTTQGPANDRGVCAGYQAKVAGWYGLINANVNSVAGSGSNGGTVYVLTQRAAGTTTNLVNTFQPGSGLSIGPTSLGYLAAGEVIWFCVGPTGSDTNDAFQMNFDIRYWNQSF